MVLGVLLNTLQIQVNQSILKVNALFKFLFIFLVNGFNAVVHREPVAVKAIAPAPLAVAKVATPFGYPYGKVAAPIYG